MTQLYDDVFERRTERSRQITQVTRRDIFDYLRIGGGPWQGVMDEIGFPGAGLRPRGAPLYGSPSPDRERGHLPAPGHELRLARRLVFSDSRFQLASGPDEVLLSFLAQVVHPVVQPDTEHAAEIVTELNRLLAPDGWTLTVKGHVSGRPVYSPARTGKGGGVAVGFAHEVATQIDAAYISQQVTRMEGAVETDPDLAIGTAKEFVESICKTILDERGVEYDKSDDLLALVKKTTKVLQLTPHDIVDTTSAAKTIKRMLSNLGTLVQGSTELRNAFGTGHGKSKTQARSRLKPRHARLAVGSAATLSTFLYKTHEERP